MTPQPKDAIIEVLSGTFETQPLVFVHLGDIAGGALDLERVDVICRVPPLPRLAHVFAAPVCDQILDLAGVRTTLVLVFPGALDGPVPETGHLQHLGQWRGRVFTG